MNHPTTIIKTKEDKPNYAKALKEAKLKMIDEDMHPFYWGGFVVLGL
jgi:CHAT domain-containing protein